MALFLFPHNQTAYEAALDMIEKHGKAAVIHPTGTGKSMIAFQLVLRHPKDRVCWISPSEYIYHTQKRSLAEAMPDFSPDMLSNLVFMTYAKLRVWDRQLEDLKPDWIILDEFHRAGSREWGKSVHKLLSLYPNAGILGLSATNVRYLDNHRDMAIELFDGHIASELTLGEAIAKRILPAPDYIVSMYACQQELQKLKRRIQSVGNPLMQSENLKLLEKLKRALEQSKGLEQTFAKHLPDFHGKYLVFCSGREHLEEMMEKSSEWFRLADPDPHFYSVTYGDCNAAKNYAAFLEDESPHLKLLFSIDMLNEGVHVKGVDGVILLRPTASPILYLQQVGRALEAGKTAKPVIFDIVNNFEGLCSIDSIRDEIQAAFLGEACQKDKGKKWESPFRIVEELRDCRDIFEEIKRNLMAGWEFYYQKAEEFYKEHGHLSVKRSYVTSDGLALGAWILTQRRVYSGKISGTLTKGQICRLNEIGMDWNSGSEQNFEKGYQALLAYYQEYGNADVKASYVSRDGYPLGRWVGNARRRYKEAFGKPLTNEQKKRLDDLGMIWDKTAYQWEKNYAMAKAYYEEFGDLEILRTYVAKDGSLLGVWLDNQRAAYLGKRPDAAPLTQTQIQRLEEIGIKWETRNERQWIARYKSAEIFYKTNRNLKVPATYRTKDGCLLAKWLSRQREQYMKHTLSKERRELLNRIGFEGDMDSYGR